MHINSYFSETLIKNYSYSLSYSYVEKSFKSISQEVSNNMKLTCVPPSKCLVHWDEKTTTTLDGSNKKKRMAILPSGIEGTKLLGVPCIGIKLKRKFGTTTSSVIKNAFDSWNCTDNVFGMVFDTKYSNTGVNSGACVLLQKVLQINILWLTFCHHVCEVVLSHVWKSLDIETS